MKITWAMWLLFGLFVVAAFGGSAMAVVGSYIEGGQSLMNAGTAIACLTIPALAGYLYLGHRE